MLVKYSRYDVSLHHAHQAETYLNRLAEDGYQLIDITLWGNELLIIMGLPLNNPPVEGLND